MAKNQTVNNSIHLFSTPISKIMQFRAGTWLKYTNESSLTLSMHYDQLMIVAEQKVLECLSMTNKMKGYFKDDTFILILSDGIQGLRKIKFQIKSGAQQCLKKLSLHFPVVNYNRNKNKNIDARYQGLDEIIKQIGVSGASSTCTLPVDFKNVVKLCLLDPTFPDVVHETMKIINDLS